MSCNPPGARYLTRILSSRAEYTPGVERRTREKRDEGPRHSDNDNRAVPRDDRLEARDGVATQVATMVVGQVLTAPRRSGAVNDQKLILARNCATRGSRALVTNP